MARKKPRQSALITTAPDTPPLIVICPRCDRRLIYRQTVYNGVNPRERWDYYHCTKCGPFDYRHRTRKLRPSNILV
jgi:hypothetical protein